ncbi:1-deoxy-D-xylulose-5-phosphate synthase [Ruminiclostridium hungatei]|uniref:1-deoxy-D-xylulose-5-phosphate synthase n=2 Tax=Ruminiclostridium hungatei TaxID=48256 RepID=A0A1V4SI21_RUMHU|nr:1-deoxy-D-xylulose-5-phosphate synthase [Ruminiclostridium hungatei]
MIINSINSRMLSKLGSRGAFGVALHEIANDNNNIIALSADLCNTSGLDRFREAFADRFINVGIAEQNMVGIAAGLANEGKVPFVTTFSNFLSMRACEQIRHFLGYMKSNVKVVGLGSGFAMGMFGNTHYGVEDLAIIRAIPNVTVISPADSSETFKTVQAAALYDGPVYIRLTGTMNNPIVYKDEYDFKIGKAVKLKNGSDINIFAAGTMVYNSVKAAELLENRGLSVGVTNMHTIKPIDADVLDEISSYSKLIVSVEEHSVVGGLGGAIAEYNSNKKNVPPHLIIGTEDKFKYAGEYKYMLEINGLLPEQIADKILSRYNSI